MRRTSWRGVALGLAVASISFGNYLRLTGIECIRAIHVISLIVCGMGLGVALASLIALTRSKD